MQSSNTQSDDSLKIEAATLIPKVIGEQPDRLKIFIDRHKEDQKRYRFSCKRHGDFLAVFLTRGPEPFGENKQYKPPNKLTCAIKLEPSGIITLHEGSGPATDLTCGLSVTREYKSDYSGPADGSKATKKVIPKYPYDNVVQLFSVQKSSARRDLLTGISWPTCNNDDYALRGFIIPGIARKAEDDRIYFSSAEASIYIPFGLGANVYATILATLKSFRECTIENPFA